MPRLVKTCHGRIRKAYGLNCFYESLLLHLTRAGVEHSSPILSHLEYLPDDQQNRFLRGLINAVFLDLNETAPKIMASELLVMTADKNEILRTLVSIMSEVMDDEWECPVLTAINYLPDQYLKDPALIQDDNLYRALHESDSLLKRFSGELLFWFVE